jgi:uncharacterized protein (TIGR01777 family)
VVNIVLAGAAGFIGTALRDQLVHDGQSVTTLVRRPPASDSEREWHPDRGLLDPDVLNGADAVVCLSGAGVGDHRWTDDYKRVLVSSRVDSVRTVVNALAKAERPPATFVCASAVGYYGDTGDRVSTETAPNGDGFLADLCRQWEAAAAPARSAEVRVVNLRTGLVLGRGGLLARLRPLFKLGVGGRLGSGRQYMPWISITDEVRAIMFCLATAAISGPANLTGPLPVTNAEFTETLARIVHRPAVIPVPAFALRTALGEFASDVLEGQRAVPAVLSEHGFVFSHQDLESALRSAL